MIDSGKAEKKMRQIIEAQGGKSTIQPEEIPIGTESEALYSDRTGKVLWISTSDIVRISREAGAPKEKGAGVVLHAKLGETVRKDGMLMEIYAEKTSKLESALALAKLLTPIVLSNKPQVKMILDQIPEKATREKAFMLDR